MTEPSRAWWRNCAVEADEEIRVIDRMQDGIAPLDPDVAKIRELISTLELCHHKAHRWVWNIVEAIGTGRSDKGLGTRAPGREHAREVVWQNACAALSAWCAGSPGSCLDFSVGSVPAAELAEGIGERSPLKEWQVQRVVDKIRSLIHWPWSEVVPGAQYPWLLFSMDETEYHDQCPACYREHEAFWATTARTLIHDTNNGEEADLSLALAIDMLWPCHWDFVENLRIVLQAIGGELHPEKPFASCGRNIARVPLQRRMSGVCDTLRVFCGDPASNRTPDPELLGLLGEPSDENRWLAASLEKTIRLQLYPPDEMLELTALAGPDWIRSGP